MNKLVKSLIIKVCDKVIKICDEPKKVEVYELEKPAQVKTEKKPFSTFKVGDILESSWGYEQTNVQFFQVVKATEKTIWFKEIKSEVVEWETGMSGKKMPLINQFKNDEILMRRISNYIDGVSMNSYSNAYRWDNKPCFFSSWA